MSEPDSSPRFTDRAIDYQKARPSYPRELVDHLVQADGLGPESRVADIGSGTGILSELLLGRGLSVRGVEPDRAMAAAAVARLGEHGGFMDVDGTAEATGLDDSSVDLVTAAQAFHWFVPEGAAAECRRILRPDACAAILWNIRNGDLPFDAAYEQFLQTWGQGYSEVQRRHAEPAALRRFFGRDLAPVRFPHVQHLDHPGLVARVLSCSYIPRPAEGEDSPMMSALGEMFERHEVDGSVAFRYETWCYLGRPGPGP